MANKIQKADCTYVYKCSGTTRGGAPCMKQVTAFETMTCGAHTAAKPKETAAKPKEAAAKPKEAAAKPKEPKPKEPKPKEPKPKEPKPKEAATKPKEAATKPKTAKPIVSVYMTRAKTAAKR